MPCECEWSGSRLVSSHGLPQDLVDWSTVAVLQRDTTLEALTEMRDGLRRLSMHERFAMATRAACVFAQYFSSVDAVATSIGAIMFRRSVCSMLDRTSAVPWAVRCDAAVHQRLHGGVEAAPGADRTPAESLTPASTCHASAVDATLLKRQTHAARAAVLQQVEGVPDDASGRATLSSHAHTAWRRGDLPAAAAGFG